MRMLALCTPSHEVLRDRWFLPTLPAGFDAEVTEIDQACPTGEYKSAGWSETVIHKFELISEAMAAHPAEIMVFSDLDIRFFDLKPDHLLAGLGDSDMAFQRNSLRGDVCTGFFVFRPCAAVSELVGRATAMMKSGWDGDDQDTVNVLLNVPSAVGAGRKLHARMKRSIEAGPPAVRRARTWALDRAYRTERHDSVVRWRYLSERFWTPGQASGGGWSPGDPLAIPGSILVHHANWTVGTANKMAQLAAGDAAVAGRRPGWMRG